MTLLRRRGPFAKRTGLFRMLGHGSLNTAGGGRRRSFSGLNSLAREARSPRHVRPETEAAGAGTHAATPPVAAANFCRIGRRCDQHKKRPRLSPGSNQVLSQNVASSDSVAGPLASASGSCSLRSSLRTTSARIDHEVIFVVFDFLPLPLGCS
jgi:hypothetical protein